MEPSLLTPILSPRLLSSFHPGYPVMTQTFVIFLRNFHLLYCSDWQKLIIASLSLRTGRGRNPIHQILLFLAFRRLPEHYLTLHLSVFAPKTLMNWFLLHLFEYDYLQ